MSVAIRTVTAADEAPALVAVILAFSADPGARWLYPAPQQYLTCFPDLVRLYSDKAVAQGSAYALEDYRGAALWLVPGVQPEAEAVIAVLKRSVAERQHAEVIAVFEQMERYHPSEAHWQLPLIGVDPPHQRHGHGAALMRHALRRCDHDQRLAYLEATSVRSIPLYERHGFAVLGTIQVGASPPLFPMVRQPR